MSLDNATATEAPATGSETTTAAPDTGGVLANRFEGIIDLDEQEPAGANLPDGTETAEAGNQPAGEAEGTDETGQS